MIIIISRIWKNYNVISTFHHGTMLSPGFFLHATGLIDFEHFLTLLVMNKSNNNGSQTFSHLANLQKEAY